MGTLAAYQAETDTVALKGGAVLRVRGLNLHDVSLLVRAHLDTVQTIFDVISAAQAGPAMGDASARFILTLAQDAPTLAGQIVAIASDEPDQGEAAAKLPFPIVVDALTKIGRLTFEEAGGVQGFVTAFAGLVGGMRSPTNAVSG